MVMDDPGYPGTWVHWVVLNLPAELRDLPEGQPASGLLPGGGIHGVNRFGTLGYRGPCPLDEPAHTYRFILYAVDRFLPLASATSKEEVLAALEGHILAESLLTGVYQRKFEDEEDY